MSSYPAFHHAFLLLRVNDSGSCCVTTCLQVSHTQSTKENSSLRLLLSVFPEPHECAAVDQPFQCTSQKSFLGQKQSDWRQHSIFFFSQCFGIRLQPSNTIHDQFLLLQFWLRKCVRVCIYQTTRSENLDLNSLKVKLTSLKRNCMSFERRNGNN